MFYTEHLQWLYLTVSGFQPVTLLKKKLRQRCFSVNFSKFLRASFLLAEHLRMAASCVYLWILKSFSEHFFYRAPSCTSCRISTNRYSKNLFPGAQPEIVQGREGFMKLRHFDKHFVENSRKRSRRENFGVFFPRYI